MNEKSKQLEMDNNIQLSNLEDKYFFDWNLKSNISQEFKNNLSNKFKVLFEKFPAIFENNTGKKLAGTSFTTEEYDSLLELNNTFVYEGSDFYTRKINVDNEELIEYISPSFVNKLLLDSSTDKNDFIKKALANHFIFEPLEKELSNIHKGELSSQDIRLKNPPHIPYADPLTPEKPSYSSHTLNLTSDIIGNLISLEFEYKGDENSGKLILAGTKNAWLKLTGDTEKTEFINTENIKKHNLYSIFTSINMSEETIANIKPGDTFISYDFDKNTKVPLINEGKVIAKGDIILDKEDNTGILITNLDIKNNEADYYETSTGNLFVITGSTYLDKKDIAALEKNKVVMLNTTTTGLFPILYNNKIIAQADIINYCSYPLIKIVKVEENPIDFAK